MNKVIQVLREFTADGHDLTERHLFPYHSWRALTTHPIVDDFTPVTITAQSITDLSSQGIPASIVTKVAIVQGQTFQGEGALMDALISHAGLSEDEIHEFGGSISDNAVRGPVQEILRQVIAYVELVNTSAGRLDPRLTSASANSAPIPVAVVTNLTRLTEFYTDVENIELSLVGCNDSAQPLVIKFKSYN